jgi:hypothetical protein
MRTPLETMNRAALLSRVAALREHMTAAAFRALTDGREPDDLSEDALRFVIQAVERALAHDNV